MTTPIHVLGFAGSLRRGSFNRGLLRAAEELLPEGMTLEQFDLRDIPLYDADVEAAAVPEGVQRFRDRIRAADGLLVSTPEYNYSIPGVLKNAIDWASRPPKDSSLADKPIGIMGAGGVGGTARGQMALRQVCVFTNLHAMNKPEMLVRRAWEQFDAEANLTNVETREQLGVFLAALAAWIRRLGVR